MRRNPTQDDKQAAADAKQLRKAQSLIGADGEVTGGLGLQGMRANREQAVEMLHKAVYQMPELTEAGVFPG